MKFKNIVLGTLVSLLGSCALFQPPNLFADNAYLQSTHVYDTNERKVVKFAFANIAAATTDGAVIAAVTGKRIRVLCLSFGAAGTATDLNFTTKPAGAGTAISATIRAAAAAWAGICSPNGLFQTASGEGLSATTGAGATVGINITYIESEP